MDNDDELFWPEVLYPRLRRPDARDAYIPFSPSDIPSDPPPLDEERWAALNSLLSGPAEPTGRA